MPLTCPTGPCKEETCCPVFDYGYRCDEVVIWQIADFGDVSGSPAEVAAIINADDNADIVLALGDNSYSGNYTNDVGAFYGTPWLSRGKLWPLPGNHDWQWGAGLSTYLAYFSFLNGARYYSKQFGIVEVFMLDDGFDTAMDVQEPDGNTAGTIAADGTLSGGSAQWRWFVRSVRASTAVWKVVCIHHPPWASGNGHVGLPGVAPNGSTTVLQWQFKALGIDLVVSGHEHSYERLIVDDLTYIVNGLGGHPVTGFGTPIAGSQVRYNSAFGALRLRFTPDMLVGEFKTAASTPDSFTLTKL